MYVITSKNHIMDTDTNKVYTTKDLLYLKDNKRILFPFYAWNTEVRRYATKEIESCLLKVEPTQWGTLVVKNSGEMEFLGLGNRMCNLADKFLISSKPNNSGWLRIIMDDMSRFRIDYQTIGKVQNVLHVDTNTSGLDAVAATFNGKRYTSRIKLSDFRSVDFGLFNDFSGGSCWWSKGHFGFPNQQLEVFYRGKNIGRSYAWLLGYFAIILSDSFEYDSLAILEGTHYGKIYVKDFMHTDNPYVVKCMMMLK